MRKLLAAFALTLLLGAPLAYAADTPPRTPQEAVTMAPIPDAPVTVPVTAVAPTATTVSVDVATIRDAIFSALGTIAAAVIPWLAWRITSWFKVSSDSQLGKIVEDAIRNGLNLAIAKAQSVSKDWTTNAAKKADIVADAQAYANTHVPQALAALDIGQTTLTEKLQSRLAAATNIAQKIPTVVETPVAPVTKPS